MNAVGIHSLESTSSFIAYHLAVLSIFFQWLWVALVFVLMIRKIICTLLSILYPCLSLSILRFIFRLMIEKMQKLKFKICIDNYDEGIATVKGE